MRSLWKKNDVNSQRTQQDSLKKKKFATSCFTFLKELSLRTLAVALWDTIKDYIV